MIKNFSNNYLTPAKIHPASVSSYHPIWVWKLREGSGIAQLVEHMNRDRKVGSLILTGVNCMWLTPWFGFCWSFTLNRPNNEARSFPDRLPKSRLNGGTGDLTQHGKVITNLSRWVVSPDTRVSITSSPKPSIPDYRVIVIYCISRCSICHYHYLKSVSLSLKKQQSWWAETEANNFSIH